jgi:uncharacterized repeat protein (TIGR01451 family)
MKRLTHILFLLLLVSAGALAQRKGADVALKFPMFSLQFHPEPGNADPSLLPFVEGELSKGKEHFGLMLRNAPASASVIEILDSRNSVVKGITVNDLLGRSSSNGVRLVGSQVTASNRRSENVYDLSTSLGKMQLLVKSLATGDAGNPASQQLVLSFAVRSSSAQTLSLRVSLPSEGAVETRPNGFIISAKSGPAVISGAVTPKPQGVAIERNMLVVSGSPVGVDAGGETALLWVVFNGSTMVSATAAKSQIAGVLDAALQHGNSPNLLIVSATDKQNLRPADTVALTLVCINIGGRGASGVVLNNPIPMGTHYLDRSATGEGTEVIYDREGSTGTVKSVKWKVQGELKPGEEQIVGFKAVVQ